MYKCFKILSTEKRLAWLLQIDFGNVFENWRKRTIFKGVILCDYYHLHIEEL